MNSIKRAGLIALLVLMMSILPASGAAVELKETIREITLDHWSETRKLQFNEYLAYKFDGISTNKIDVTIEVVSGDSIDMFLMNSEDFTGFQSMMKSGKSKPYNSYSTGQGMNLRYITYSFEIQEDGTYYIVEDNTYLPNEGGVPGGSVEVKINFTRTRCLECEEAMEAQKKLEEEARLREEIRRQLQEEMNQSKVQKTAPGFEMILSISGFLAFYLLHRKKYLRH